MIRGASTSDRVLSAISASQTREKITPLHSLPNVCLRGRAGFWRLMVQQNCSCQKRSGDCICVGKHREATRTPGQAPHACCYHLGGHGFTKMAVTDQVVK